MVSPAAAKASCSEDRPLKLNTYVTIGKAGEIRERGPLDLRQRMPRRHDDPTAPLIARQQHVLAEQLVRPGCHGKVDPVHIRHLGNLLGGALVQMKLHVGITKAELLDDGWQYVTRLRVRGPYRQRAAIVFLEVFRQSVDVLRFAQHFQRVTDDPLARRCHARQRPPAARENIEIPAHPPATSIAC